MMDREKPSASSPPPVLRARRRRRVGRRRPRGRAGVDCGEREGELTLTTAIEQSTMALRDPANIRLDRGSGGGIDRADCQDAQVREDRGWRSAGEGSRHKRGRARARLIAGLRRYIGTDQP